MYRRPSTRPSQSKHEACTQQARTRVKETKRDVLPLMPLG